MTCPTCKGSGGAGNKRTCPTCKGVIVQVGHCATCWNAGNIEDACRKCGGSGQVPNPK